MNKHIINLLSLLLLFPLVSCTATFCGKADFNLNNSKDAIKPRVVVVSDFPPLDTRYPFADGTPNNHKSDPDDLQSMVRFLLCSNEFDVEGLVASSATFAGIADKQNILDMLDIYDDVDDILINYDSNYPSADDLREVTYQGLSGTWGKTVDNNIGDEKDSEASWAIIDIIDKEDERPVWFCMWGDCSPVSQAIWRARETKSADDFERFISKIRIFQIAHQDDTIDWLMQEFPELFIIYSKNTYQGVFGLSDRDWVETNVIENHMSLGRAYPPRGMGCEGVCEGDSPSFLYLLSSVKGISNAEDPTDESWGGQYRRVEGTNHYVDDVGGSSISKWSNDIQDDFVVRLKLIEEK